MDEPSVEEIVGRWEKQPGAIISQHEIDRIIASWRERGDLLREADKAKAEAVEAMRAKCAAIARKLATHPDRNWSTAAFLVANEIAALKDTP